MKKIKVTLITNFPSYHQVDLFNAISYSDKIELSVVYLRKMTIGRSWNKLNEIKHKHIFLKEYNSKSHFYINTGILECLSKLKPDLIIATQYASITMQIILYLSFFKGTNIIFWSERPYVEFTELPILSSKLLRIIFRKIALIPLFWVDEIWGIGKRATNYFQKMFPNKCSNFPYYFDTEPFHQLNEKSFQKAKILYAGKLNYRKGIDIFLESSKEILKKYSDIEIAIAGNGECYGQIEALTLKYPNSFKYIGFFELDEIPLLFSQYNIFVFPTRYDGWGMVLVEAMVSGMVVLTSNKAGSAIDILKDGVNGYKVDKLDSENITAKLEFIIGHLDNMNKISEEAQKNAMKYHSKNGMINFENKIMKFLKVNKKSRKKK